MRYLWPWGRGPLENFKGPDTWQVGFLREWGEDIRSHPFDGFTPVMPIMTSTTSGHGVGKLQALDDIVPTPSGSRRWGDLQPGDMLFGADGLPVRIKARRDHKDCPMMRVTFDDGSHLDVSTGHLWNVRGRQERRNGLDTWRTLETIEIARLGVKRSNGQAQARQWEIPAQDAAAYPAVDVGVDPYVLGLWLGDGGRNSARITSADMCVVARIHERGYTTHIGSKRGTDAKSITIHGIGPKLRALGVFDKHAYSKSIPLVAMENSIEFRAELLRGLLDTDGEATAQSGCIVFSSTSKQLADDVVWLARSLGGKARISETVKMPLYRDADGDKVAGRPCWRATLRMPEGFQSFHIQRKQERVGPCEARYLSRWIESIEPIAPADGMCVEVDAADGLYQANDFIVTHNSALVGMIVGVIMSSRPMCRGRVTANSIPQLETTTWPEIVKWANMMLTRRWFKITSGRGAMKMVHRLHPELWRVEGMAWDASRPAAFAGKHAADSTTFYVIDEASEVARIVLETAQGGLTDGEPMFFMFSNPTKPAGFFFDSHHDMAKRYRTYKVDSRTAKMTNKQLINQWIEDWGMESDFVKVRVLGEFPTTGDAQFIPTPLVVAAMDPLRESYSTIHDPVIIGVDVARFGDDETTIYVRRGRDARSIPPVIIKGQDTLKTALVVKKLAADLLADAINVDGGGVGGGVIDNLNGWGVPNVYEINFGGTSLDPDYHLMNTYMMAETRKWLLQQGVTLPIDMILKRQLTLRQYSFQQAKTGTTIKIQSKEEMKEDADIKESPDRADGFGLTFATPVAMRDANRTRAELAGERHSNVVGVDYDR